MAARAARPTAAPKARNFGVVRVIINAPHVIGSTVSIKASKPG